MLNMNFQPLTYNRQIIDNGLILGTRKHKGELKRRYYPLYAKVNGVLASQITPHKHDLFVYIPESAIHTGDLLFITDVKQEKILKVIEKTEFSVCMDLLYFEEHGLNTSDGPEATSMDEEVF